MELQLAKVVGVQKQVVAGTNYFLHLQASHPAAQIAQPCTPLYLA
jgi:hypothetical protein